MYSFGYFQSKFKNGKRQPSSKTKVQVKVTTAIESKTSNIHRANQNLTNTATVIEQTRNSEN